MDKIAETALADVPAHILSAVDKYCGPWWRERKTRAVTVVSFRDGDLLNIPLKELLATAKKGTPVKSRDKLYISATTHYESDYINLDICYDCSETDDEYRDRLAASVRERTQYLQECVYREKQHLSVLLAKYGPVET